MKNNLSIQYKALFREELYPRGFSLHKKTFYRVINDVVQTLMLCKTATNFTIGFSITPLCLPIKDLYCEGYDISALGKRTWWDCWNGVEESVFEEILSLFRQYVLPFFEHGVDAKTAYHELVQLEKMIYTDIPSGVIMHNYKFVCLCMKSGDFEKARHHMAAIVKQNENGHDNTVKEYEKMGNLEARDRYLEQYVPKIRRLKEELYKISVPDVKYIQELVAQNEAVSLEYLRHPNKL